MLIHPFIFVFFVGVFLLNSPDVPRWLAIYLIAVNGATFLVYGWDKSMSRRGNRRIPEATLHLLTAAGAVPGAAAGQLVFRHKTQKKIFQAVFIAIAVLQMLALLWWMIQRIAA